MSDQASTEISYGPLAFGDPEEVEWAARIHESAPLNWDPDYEVTDLRVGNWVKFLGEAANDPKVHVSVARLGPRLVGLHWLVMAEKHGVSCAHIQSLWVDPQQRSRGIGKALKDRGEAWAKSRGAKFVWTEVFYANQRMIDYNLRLGFSAGQVEMTKALT